MKKELSPGIAALVIVIVLAVVGFFFWRGTGSPGSVGKGGVGNKSPFGPGGAAIGKGGGMPSQGGGAGRPFSPRGPGAPGGATGQ